MNTPDTDKVDQPRLVIDGQAGTAEDWAVLSHLRGWCHDMSACQVCTAYTAGRRAGIDTVAVG